VDTRHGTLIGKDATVIQVDANPRALGARHRIDLGVPSDVVTAARAVTAELERRGQQARGYRTPDVAARLAAEGRWRDVPFEAEREEGRIDPRTLTIALDDLLPQERTVATDSGNFMGYPAMFLSVPTRTAWCSPRRSSRSASASPPRSARPSPALTGSRSPRSATAAP